MKNSKINLKALIFTVLISIAGIFTACSEESSIISSNYNEPTAVNLPTNSITIEPYWEGQFLMFRIRNNSQDTVVNDFHVQFDTTVKITGYIIVGGWQIDPQTTDLNKGKFGVKKGPNGQNIPPNGGVGIPCGVQLLFTGVTKKNPRQWWDFDWQATRDGIVVKAGKGAFPSR
jgi:hypothetical protein